MGVKDYVGSTVKLSQVIQFNIKDLYSHLRLWFGDRGYDIAEPRYSEEFTRDGKKVVKFKWVCDKKMDPYTKLVIELSFSSKTGDVVAEKDEKKDVMQEGEVDIEITSYINRDIEDEWTLRRETALQKFFRELYDLFSKKNKYEDYERKLKQDIDAIVYDIKTYLRQHRFD